MAFGNTYHVVSFRNKLVLHILQFVSFTVICEGNGPGVLLYYGGFLHFPLYKFAIFIVVV